MTEDAVFRLASITKPVVTVSAMRLVEQRRLRLEDPVTRWLPDFTPRLPDGTAPVITLAQLMTHTAGLSYRFLEPPDSPYHRLDVSDGLDQPGLSLAENLDRLVQAPLAYQPGTAWRYSLRIDVLGAVMEAATGQSLPEVVAELVTSPLGLGDLSFAVTDPARLVPASGPPQDAGNRRSRIESGTAPKAGCAEPNPIVSSGRGGRRRGRRRGRPGRGPGPC